MLVNYAKTRELKNEQNCSLIINQRKIPSNRWATIILEHMILSISKKSKSWTKQNEEYVIFIQTSNTKKGIVCCYQL